MVWCWHRWGYKSKIIGKYQYEECSKCGKRRAIDLAPELHGVIDQKWLDTVVWSVVKPPPKPIPADIEEWFNKLLEDDA